MEFVHTPYQPGETIAAIATPPGEGGVAIVRISGSDAESLAEQMLSCQLASTPSHKATYGKVLGPQSEQIDDALILVMRAPRSYTGETTVEIHCHGGALVSKRVLERALTLGARGAKPGEFTFRAFLNGKMDLAQAEAVQELISAKNEFALDAAERHLQGGLSQKITSFQTQLTHVAAILEAWVDFPEEGLEFTSHQELVDDLKQIHKEMRTLLDTYHDGKIAHDGIALCLIGTPNVGKSSLMNALLGKDRAIVTHIPGTTRDLIEDYMQLGGLNFRLIDTAGIRQQPEHIEKEGIRRSKIALSDADLVLFVVDGHTGLTEEGEQLIPLLPPEKTIPVWNKLDLSQTPPPPLPFRTPIAVSAKKGEGLKQLKQAIDTVIWESGPPSKEEILLTNLRHKQTLEEAADACETLIEGLIQNRSPELLTQTIRTALTALGKIIGVDVDNEILNEIFSTFCIGK